MKMVRGLSILGYLNRNGKKATWPHVNYRGGRTIEVLAERQTLCYTFSVKRVFFY